MNTSQMNAVEPLNGALVFNVDVKCIFVFEGTAWKNLCDSGSDNQSLSFNNETNILTLENGGSIDLSSYIDTDDQALTFDDTTNILTLEDGGTVDLNKFLDDTDTDNQTITAFSIDGSNVLTITLEDGNTETVDLSSLNNSGTDDQALTFNNTTNILTLEDGGTVDLNKFLDDTDTDNQTITAFSIDGSNVLTITLEDGNTETVDLSSLNNSGTDDQALTFNNTTNILTLEDGGTVDLNKFLDDTDTDNQTITAFSIDGSNVLTITLEDGNTQTVNLTALVNDADFDITNEIQNITTTGTAGNISISSGSTLALNVNDADADPLNEIQTITSNDGSVLVTPSGNNYNLSVSSSNLSWDLLGNSGTNPATNFLGTTNAQDLVLRSNNIEKLRFLIHATFEDKASCQYDLSRTMRRINA